MFSRAVYSPLSNSIQQGVNFMDITDHQMLGMQNAVTRSEMGIMKTVEFPEKVMFEDTIKPLLKNLNKDNMKANLEKFTSFYTRYYKVWN
jgi:leucyl aminopeptidase